MTTPDAEAVAALAAALHDEFGMWCEEGEIDEVAWDVIATRVLDERLPAGWTLARRSEREALVELAALVSEVYAHVGPDGQHLPERDKHVQIWVHTSTRDRMGDLYAKHVDVIREAGHRA